MIEAYSQNIDVNANSNVPFEIVKVNKGYFEDIQNTSITFNKCGVYRVAVNGTVSATEAGNVGIELVKNGVLQEDTLTQVTVAENNLYPISFSTFVQVSSNNTNCACSSPTSINVRNVGIAATFELIKIDVDKIC